MNNDYAGELFAKYEIPALKIDANRRSPRRRKEREGTQNKIYKIIMSWRLFEFFAPLRLKILSNPH
jgi:hypothetical protein